MSTTTKNGHTAGVYDDPVTLLPPHNIQAEKAVIGSILIDPDGLPELSLKPEMFYNSLHGKIFESFLMLREKKRSIDFLTVTDHLKSQNLEEDIYLLSLINEVPTSVNMHSYAKIVEEKYNRRRLIRAAGAIAQDSYDEEKPFDSTISGAIEGIRGIAGDNEDGGPRSNYQIANQLLDKLTDRKDNPNSANEDITTGFVDLDRILQGLEPGSFVVCAARPGMGKTLFEQAVAEHNAVKKGKRVARFNLEMTATQLMTRQVSTALQIPYKEIMNPKGMNDNRWEAVMKAIAKISEMPIYIDDTAGLTLLQLESRLHRLFSKYGHFPLVTIDYLQLMRSGTRTYNRVEEVGQISSGLKNLAKDMNTVIWANAQLSRALETRAVKVPILPDLRESGSIEQDADSVLFLYRDDYYYPDSQRPNQMDIVVAKNRNAPAGDEVSLYVNFERMRIANLTREEVK